MVAELPVDSGTFMAAMMLQIVVAGSLLVAMGTCIVYGFFEMRRREQEYEFTSGLNDLPTVTIATKTGTKYHRKHCQHLLTHVVAGNPGVRNYEPCQDCFPERYTYQEKKERQKWCYGVTAGFVLLTGFVLGSLATVCGMIVGPGTYTFKVKEPWQALGYSVEKNMVKEELALGDVQTSKDVRRGRRESQKRRERKGTYESDESELMMTWTSFLARPNMQQDFSAKRNFNVDTVNVDDTTAYMIRNESDYKKERSANSENQECESLESGYAPRYLVKEVSQEPAVLREFFPESREFVSRRRAWTRTGTSQAYSLYRNTFRIGYLDRPNTFFAFVLCDSAEEKETARHEQGQEQKSQSRNKEKLQSTTHHGAHLQQPASSTRNGRSIQTACRGQPANTSRNTNSSRGDQEHSSHRISERSRISTSFPADSSNSSGTKLSSSAGTHCSPAVSSDNDGGNRSKPGKGCKGTEAR